MVTFSKNAKIMSISLQSNLIEHVRKTAACSRLKNSSTSLQSSFEAENQSSLFDLGEKQLHVRG